MADNLIEVVFGARTAELLAGVAEAKEAIESLREPIDSFVSGLSGIGEALGAAFAVEKIKEFAIEMAEAGERALNSANILGQSVHDYEQLRGAMILVGGDAETAQRTMERLALSVQRVAEGNKGTIAAFHNLGISTEEVRSKSNNLTDLITLLVERFGELAPGLRNIGVLHELAGRGVDRLAGALRQGAEGWQEALKGAAEYADVSARVDPLSADTAEHINKLSLDLQTLAKEGFANLKPAIDAVVAGIDTLVGALTSALEPIQSVTREMSGWEIAFRVVMQTIRDVITILGIFKDALNSLVLALKEFADKASAIFIGLVEMMKSAVSGGDVEAAYERMMGRLEAITQSRGNEIVGIWEGIVNRITGLFGGGSVPLPDVNVTAPAVRGTRQLGTEGGKGGKEKDTTNKEYEDFAAEERLKIAEARGDFDKINAIYEEWAARAKAIYGEGSKQYREVLLAQVRAHQQAITQMFSQQESAYSTQVSIDEQYRKAFENNMKAMATTHQITKQQEFGFDIQYAAQLYQQQRKQLEDMIQNDAFTKEEKTKLYQQLLELHAKYAAQLSFYDDQIVKANQDDADKIAKPFTAAFDQIGSAFSSAIDGMISHTMTWGKAMQSVLNSILKGFTKMIQDMLSQWAASGLANLLGVAGGGEGGLGAVLGKATGGLFSGILGKLFGGAIGTALGGPVGGFFGSEAGSLALNSVPNFAMGGIASAAGGWALPSMDAGGTLANLHSNEMVLPSSISTGLQNAINGGGFGSGQTIHNWNVSAVDGASVAKFFRANGPALVAALNTSLRNGSALRPNGSY